MKNLLICLIALLCVSCCKDEEPERPVFTKTYMMEFVSDNYSEIVEVKLEEIDLPNWRYNQLRINFIAKGNPMSYWLGDVSDYNASTIACFTKTDDNTEYIICGRHVVNKIGSFRIDNEKTSYFEGNNYTLTEIP